VLKFKTKTNSDDEILTDKTVQLPMSAENVALLDFAATAPAVQQSIDISYSPGPQQQTRRAAYCCSGRIGRTDGRTQYRCVDPAPHTMMAVPVNNTIRLLQDDGDLFTSLDRGSSTILTQCVTSSSDVIVTSRQRPVSMTDSVQSAAQVDTFHNQ